ncbi:hypothetical protein BDV27DRAFT_109639 [Aspergillus caelatus]|uniref:Uncharacterized protein n=2 Tax=Aspergillus subgen. Circumdati TaxID=2720871 RepID=A0A5N7AJ14_9EURO|nr:uncharacterized protein BDV27DRAFT_109639 [Aspergillus caelatus]KAE8369881.1 hypothetical protein BDV27DRAFT_109639 [Aspergillus caelatus]KAE8412759.1 hypothetical protein BDV36DRAFT_48531 [Aspergillus pseudocaelatus]
MRSGQRYSSQKRLENLNVKPLTDVGGHITPIVVSSTGSGIRHVMPSPVQQPNSSTAQVHFFHFAWVILAVYGCMYGSPTALQRVGLPGRLVANQNFKDITSHWWPAADDRNNNEKKNAIS